MTDAMLELSRCFFGVGARIRSSRWNNSHQNGSEFLVLCEAIMVSIILRCRARNHFSLFPFR